MIIYYLLSKRVNLINIIVSIMNVLIGNRKKMETEVSTPKRAVHISPYHCSSASYLDMRKQSELSTNSNLFIHSFCQNRYHTTLTQQQENINSQKIKQACITTEKGFNLVQFWSYEITTINLGT